MPTWGQVVDDIAVAMGFTHDDALRHRGAILYNAVIIANKLKNQQIKKHEKTGDAMGISYMVSTIIVPVTHVDVDDNVVTDFDASYFDLPVPIMDLDYGNGINMVRYLRNNLPPNCPPAVARTPFTQTTLPAVYNLYKSAYQAPRADRPYFARNKAGSIDRAYLFGVPAGVTHLLLSIYAAADFTSVSFDDEVDLPQHLFQSMKKLILELESWMLQIPQERLGNDGRDFQPGQVVQTRPIISVNAPEQFDN